jgi:hypothetical protein
VRQILFAGEKPYKWPASVRDLIADRPAQHRIAGFERVENRALRDPPLDVDAHLAAYARQLAKMDRERDSDHASVRTSTESTAGRSRMIGVQLSPASADA